MTQAYKRKPFENPQLKCNIQPYIYDTNFKNFNHNVLTINYQTFFQTIMYMYVKYDFMTQRATNSKIF